jgi:Complex I intermediate-associated protein 30 (CIA30)
MYISCRLASDDEPHRRVWKMTTRTESSRGEVLYQAPFELNKGNDWNTVRIPFESFRKVRGPRLVPNAPPLNTTGGLYQIGMTMSKFTMGGEKNITELGDFRSGFFELQIRDIGFYSRARPIHSTAGYLSTLSSNFAGIASAVEAPAPPPNVPRTLSQEEVARRRPLLLKVLLTVAKLFFSEQRYDSSLTQPTSPSCLIPSPATAAQTTAKIGIQNPD